MSVSSNDVSGNGIQKILDSDLEEENHLLRNENLNMKQQIRQLQNHIDLMQQTDVLKDKKIEKLTEKMRLINARCHDLDKQHDHANTSLTQLQSLYQSTYEQLTASAEENDNLKVQISKLKKQISKLDTDNLELRTMLDRTTENSQQQIRDNAILTRQLRKQMISSEPSPEVIKLRAQLRTSYSFIKKLQKQIQEYRQSRDIPSYQRVVTTKHKHHSYKYRDDISCGSADSLGGNILQPQLDILDKELHNLESTVHQSRKILGISSSSFD